MYVYKRASEYYEHIQRSKVPKDKPKEPELFIHKSFIGPDKIFNNRF